MMPAQPRSSARWICELSFQAGRTIGATRVVRIAVTIAAASSSETGPCSMSTSSQSQPVCAIASATNGSENCSQAPSTDSPASIRCRSG